LTFKNPDDAVESKGLTVAQKIAKFIARTRFSSLEPEVVHAVKRFILDQIGCIVGAKGLLSSDAMLITAKELGATQESTILGYGLKAHCTAAALANGMMGHSLEMDDVHNEGTVHPAVTVIPSSLAMGEKCRISGTALLEAVAVGYETTIRLGRAFVGKLWFQGFHPTSVCGVFGATAASAKAMGLTEHQIVNALGLAGSQASGLREARAAGTWGKRFQPGNAARGGVLSALLARDGFSGPETIFEGDNGLYRAYAHKGEYDLNKIDESLGETWELPNISFKIHACCRFCAPIIDAVLEIKKENSVEADEVDRIWVGTYQLSIDALTKPEGKKFRPQTIVDAQFSLPYCAAVAVRKGRASVEDFTEKSIRDDDVLDLASKVSWELDQEAEQKYPRCFSAIVKITSNVGQEVQARVDYPKGDPENPASDDELFEKFRSLAAGTLGERRCEQVRSAVFSLDEMKDIRELTELLCQPGNE
jgi:2-methylcitrate dehydratase PrpD